MSPAAGCAVLALLCAGAAGAQTQVYRCGPDGRSYSQEPCTQGRAIDVADARSAQQAAQTRLAAQRDAQRADEMERERRQAERLAMRQGPALIGRTTPRTTEAAPAPRAKPRGDKASRVTLYQASVAR